MASPFMTGPFVPAEMLNLIRAVLGIHHHRFNLSVKRSRILSAVFGLSSVRSSQKAPHQLYKPSIMIIGSGFRLAKLLALSSVSLPAPPGTRELFLKLEA